MGAVPLEWYKDEEHIGYDVEGQRLEKRPQKDKLDKLLARNDGKGLTIYDDYNDEEITLTKEEIRMLQRIRKGTLWLPGGGPALVPPCWSVVWSPRLGGGGKAVAG